MTLTCLKTGRFWHYATTGQHRAARHLGMVDYTIEGDE
jgi:hypothetical protein